MADSNKNNNNWGLFAVAFAAIYGVLRGALKIGEKIEENVQSRNEEIKKLHNIIRDKLQAGFTDNQILEATYNDAVKFFGRELTSSEKDRINDIFVKERAKISELEVSSARQNYAISNNDNEIRKIYYELSQKYHPDRSQSPETQKFMEEIMKKINRAYQEKDIEKLKAFL